MTGRARTDTVLLRFSDLLIRAISAKRMFHTIHDRNPCGELPGWLLIASRHQGTQRLLPPDWAPHAACTRCFVPVCTRNHRRLVIGFYDISGFTFGLTILMNFVRTRRLIDTYIPPHDATSRARIARSCGPILECHVMLSPEPLSQNRVT